MSYFSEMKILRKIYHDLSDFSEQIKRKIKEILDKYNRIQFIPIISFK